MSTPMTNLAMSPQMAATAASQQELVQKKLSIDSLRKRLGDPASKEKKLRESCEGFESVFLQKMWEEMRKNVNKEGYLHSKDEEMYQSMFDVELAKKMTSAGGIGLADMLYDQLSQQLSDTGRTKTPSARKALPVDAALSKIQEPRGPIYPEGELKPEDLYSALDEEKEDIPTSRQSLEKTILEIRADLAGVTLPSQHAEETVSVGTNSDAPEALVDVAPPLIPETIEKMESNKHGITATTWKATNTKVSAKSKPLNPRKSKSRVMRPDMSAEQILPKKFASNRKESLGALPADARWPLEGEISSGFGWQDDGTGKRHWNAGITIAGKPGSPVTACLEGKVLFSGPAEGYDNLIVLDHGNDYKSYYGNITKANVSVGDMIPSGTAFAELAVPPSQLGEKENSAALFFALKKGEMALNPEAAIPKLVTASR